jgi:nucleotide-binding universal stress UspA family protein
MHGLIRYRSDSEDLLYRSFQAVLAALAERKARATPGLSVTVMAGLLLVAGGEEAVAAFVARLERLGVVGAVQVEVDRGEEEASELREYVLDRTDAASVVATAVRGPAGG